MKKNIELLAFILLGTGTFGLLLNELAFIWGRTAVLTFAFFNIFGLALLFWSKRKS